MKYLPSFIIYSLDRPGNARVFGNTYTMHDAMEKGFNDLDWAGHQAVRGFYKGESELSYVAPLGELDSIRHAAACTQQECILIVENGSAYLEYLPTLRREYLGQWSQISKIQAEGLDNYTVYNDKYFAAIGA